MSEVMKIIKPGLATSVQDLGRKGYQQYGVVVSGAMDDFALQVANLLVGNLRGEAGLEIALIGPEISMVEDTVIAVCGANLSPKLDGESISNWKSYVVEKGQILTFGKPKNGGYAYVAVAGGVKTPEVMGSKSTYVKTEMGGYKGRYLEKGDCVEAGTAAYELKRLAGRSIKLTNEMDYHAHNRIRIVLGPDSQGFSEESIQHFLTSAYQVTPQSDRMGYRLDGPALEGKADIISDAVLPGTIQVPADGKPIVLLADRQTTGGYARIASVISVDLPYVAQQRAGNELRFVEVSVKEAQQLYVQRELLLKRLNLGAGRIK
ncbi:biotin-dependent carboxyltransferase family protein [Virgibacillus oceani]